MLKTVKDFICKHHMIEKEGDKVLLGISGGPDSMTLLHLFIKLREEWGIKLAAAHLNHGLRPEAEWEMDYLQSYCAAHKIDFYTRFVDVDEYARRAKKSVEEAGRDLRYQFFEDISLQFDCTKLATAHHKDDRAETVLMHLLRGSGIKGLRSIMPVSGFIIRPLLSVSKSDILTYLKGESIHYFIDDSNSDRKYFRNRVRLELLPLLQDYNPQIIAGLNQLADIAEAEDHVLEEETDALWEQLIISVQCGKIVLNNRKLLTLMLGHKRRIVLKALSEMQGPSGWSLNDIDYVLDLASKPGSAKHINLPKGVLVSKQYEKLIFSNHRPEPRPFIYEVTIPGKVKVIETGELFSFTIIPAGDLQSAAGETYFDFDKLELPLFLRSRKDGDRFEPSNMGGSKKLKDFFVDIKLPVVERDKVPILASQHRIYALLGYRLDRNALVHNDTRNILVVKREGREDFSHGFMGATSIEKDYPLC